MATNPFDPALVQVKKTLDRTGVGSAVKGYGSVRSRGAAQSRPARPPATPDTGPENLSELLDVDVVTTPPEPGQALVWDADLGVWLPGSVAPGGGGGGGGDSAVFGFALSDTSEVIGQNYTDTSSGGFASFTATFRPTGLPVVLERVRIPVFAAGTYEFKIDGTPYGGIQTIAASGVVTFELGDYVLDTPAVFSYRMTTGSVRMRYNTDAGPKTVGPLIYGDWNEAAANIMPAEFDLRQYVLTPIPSGGGGGSAERVWTTPVAAPSDVDTGWTNYSGTWTSGGTYGINQTNGGQDNWRSFATPTDLPVGTNLRAIKATVRITSNGSWLGFGFWKAAGWNSGAFGIGLNTGGNVQYDRYGSGGSSFSAGKVIALNTDYVLEVIEYVQSGRLIVKLDDVIIRSELIPSAYEAMGTVGLYTRGSQGWWRDISVSYGKAPDPALPSGF